MSLNIISTYPPLPESLLSSLLEVDEVLPLSRELADQSKPEILPDSELDDKEVDVAAASATSSGAAWASRFDGDPSPLLGNSRKTLYPRNVGFAKIHEVTFQVMCENDSRIWLLRVNLLSISGWLKLAKLWDDEPTKP
jgi:hypothetical protein